MFNFFDMTQKASAKQKNVITMITGTAPVQKTSANFGHEATAQLSQTEQIFTLQKSKKLHTQSIWSSFEDRYTQGIRSKWHSLASTFGILGNLLVVCFSVFRVEQTIKITNSIRGNCTTSKAVLTAFHRLFRVLNRVVLDWNGFASTKPSTSTKAFFQLVSAHQNPQVLTNFEGPWQNQFQPNQCALLNQYLNSKWTNISFFGTKQARLFQPTRNDTSQTKMGCHCNKGVFCITPVVCICILFSRK